MKRGAKIRSSFIFACYNLGWNVGLENPSLTPLFTELLDSSIRQSSHIFMHMRAIIHIKIKSKGEKVIP